MTINALGILPIKTDSCPAMWKHAVKKKMTVPKGSQKPGDLVFYDFNGNGTADHIGLVVEVHKGYILAVEGNTGQGNDTNGGQVQRRKRSGHILGYARPKYTAKITANMVVATALMELGITESPKNSNKVKYNLWFYGKNVSAYWCCTFVCWLFGNVMEVKKVTKPTGKHSITLVNKEVKRGSKGDHVLKVQKFLNWYHPGWKLKEDKECGKNTQAAIMSFQLTEGLTVDGVFGEKSRAKANTYKAAAKKAATPAPAKKAPAKKPAATPAKKPAAAKKTTTKPTTTTPAKKPAAKPAAPVKKGYAGKFPAPNNNIKIVNSLAYRYCWPYGTPQSKYKFKGGKPTDAYKKGIDESFPNHNTWKSKRQRNGACCDILVATCLRHVDIKVKKDLKDQLVDMPKMSSKLKWNGHHKASDFKMGDVVQRGRKDKSGHTWIVCELINGKKYVANAHYKKLNGTYAVMDAVPKTIVPSKWKYYKCYTVQGAVRTYYKQGDYGYDVYYIQKFLQWYGYKIAADGYFGAKTAEAVSKFQKSLGWKPCGQVGEKTIEAMKKVRK